MNIYYKFAPINISCRLTVLKAGSRSASHAHPCCGISPHSLFPSNTEVNEDCVTEVQQFLLPADSTPYLCLLVLILHCQDLGLSLEVRTKKNKLGRGYQLHPTWFTDVCTDCSKWLEMSSNDKIQQQNE